MLQSRSTVPTSMDMHTAVQLQYRYLRDMTREGRRTERGATCGVTTRAATAASGYRAVSTVINGTRLAPITHTAHFRTRRRRALAGRYGSAISEPGADENEHGRAPRSPESVQHGAVCAGEEKQ